MKTIAQLIVPRETPALIELNRNIYIAGGYNNKDKRLSSCEQFNLQELRVKAISPLNNRCNGLRLCAFNQKYIVKIGGFYPDNSKHTELELEVYSPLEDKWFLVAKIEGGNAVEPGYNQEVI
jgi:hypothetical protein